MSRTHSESSFHATRKFPSTLPQANCDLEAHNPDQNPTPAHLCQAGQPNPSYVGTGSARNFGEEGSSTSISSEYYTLQGSSIGSTEDHDSDSDYVYVPKDHHIRLDTMKRVGWDALLSKACRLMGVQNGQWGEDIAGGYNLVRFLELDDAMKTTVAVRVPLHERYGACEDEEDRVAVCNQYASEVATMQFLKTHTRLPVPKVLQFSIDVADESVGCPYLIMEKSEGTPLHYVWDEMLDGKRDIILQQIVDIVLEMATHTFDKVGALMPDDEGWSIHPCSLVADPKTPRHMKEALSVVYSRTVDYWWARATAKMRDTFEDTFGADHCAIVYARLWLIRSLVLNLASPTLDGCGFPLCHSDFFPRNILIVDADSNPRISAILDWESTTTASMLSLAQYPPFIIDRPEADPLRERNARDREVFVRLMREAERHMNPCPVQPLAPAVERSLERYSLQQILDDSSQYGEFADKLLRFYFGKDEYYVGNVYEALLVHGVLKEAGDMFWEEREVLRDAKSVFPDIVDRDLSRDEFIKFMEEHREEFAVGGTVNTWLRTQSSRTLPDPRMTL